jgi:hypothetical protein
METVFQSVYQTFGALFLPTPHAIWSVSKDVSSLEIKINSRKQG